MPGPTDRPWFADPRLSDISPNVLKNRKEEPVRITSPAVQWAIIQTGAIANPNGRGLFTWEYDIIYDIFQGGVDASRVNIVQTTVLNAPTTLGNNIRVPPGWSFENDNRPVLVHEMTHVWQYQIRGTDYITDSAFHNASGQIQTGNRNVAYMNYHLEQNSIMANFTAEEQATIVGDYYEMTRIYLGGKAELPEWVKLRKADLPIYERLLKEVQSTVPRTETRIYQESLMQPLPGGDPTSSVDSQFVPLMPFFQIRFKGL